MAAFVVAFPGFTPDDYWRLTVADHAALVTAHNRANKR